MSDDAEQLRICRDALDHIARVAGMARVPTRRLDWIQARARAAHDGKPYDRDDLPQYPKSRAPTNPPEIGSKSVDGRE